MAGVGITIQANGESLIVQALERFSGLDQTKQQLFEAIGSTVSNNIRRRWMVGEGLEGKWRISGRVARQGGTTLRDTSRLMNSITHNVLPNGVEIGTDVEYAAIHHFGGEINHEARMRRAYFRQGRDGTVGNRFVRQSRSNFMQETMGKPYKVNMPRRPFLGLTETDENEVMDIIVEHLSHE